MKLHALSSLALATALALGGAACSQSYHSGADSPKLSLSSDHNTIQVGEVVWVHATAVNLTNSDIKWKVSPNTASITPDSSRQDQWAKFTAKQPGGYEIEARADAGNDQTVRDRTTIQVVSTSQ